ncbi:MAG: hypothetical protein ACI4EX_06715 [Lachnospiraceae bacterium]
MVLIAVMLATALPETGIYVDAVESVAMESMDVVNLIEDVSNGNIADETVSDGNEGREEKELTTVDAEIVASKTVNDCTWTLDSDGILTVRDSEGETGKSGDWGFSDYKEQIKTVDMDISYGTKLDYMFSNCTNLESAKSK